MGKIREVQRFWLNECGSAFAVTSDGRVLYWSGLDRRFRRMCKCATVGEAIEYARKRAEMANQAIEKRGPQRQRPVCGRNSP